MLLTLIVFLVGIIFYILLRNGHGKVLLAGGSLQVMFWVLFWEELRLFFTALLSRYLTVLSRLRFRSL